MAIIINQKKKRKEFAHGLEKLLKGNPISTIKSGRKDKYTTVIDGEVIRMAPDLVNLTDIDENDPHLRQWILETEANWRKRSSHRTSEEAQSIIDKKLLEIKNLRR